MRKGMPQPLLLFFMKRGDVLSRKLTALILTWTLLAASAMTFPAAAEEQQESGEARILVIETTDIHGYIMSASSGRTDRIQYRLARIAQVVDEVRSSGQYDDVILLDGGDLYQGTPVSLMTGGAVIRAALDEMGYDAAALGNHEFDWDVTEYAADQEGTIAPYVLGDYFGDPKIPVLASNLYDAVTGERVNFTKDYTILEKAGKRIAVIGYIPDYSREIMTSMISPYTIDGDLGKLDTLVREIDQKEQPDATIILAHEDPEAVAQAMDPAQVDLVCGGHTHESKADIADNGIPYIQGYCYGYGFASAELIVETDGTVKVEDVKYTDIMEDQGIFYDTEENSVYLDPDIMEIAHAGWDAIQEEMSEVLGYIDTPVLRDDRIGANSAGNWITGLYLRATQDQGTVAAFYNNGGIRADLKIPKGRETRDVTVYDIYSVNPFGNSLLVYEINAQELAKQLVNGLKSPNHGDQMSGLTFTYTATGDENTDRRFREYTILSIMLDDGTQVDPDDTQTLYRVCTTNYNATVHGSVFTGKEPVVPEADAPVDNEAIIRLLREEKQENDGHITVDAGPRGTEISE